MRRIDQVALRVAFGSYPTGVTVVTTRGDDGQPVGFTANSFASVSLDPPLLLVCPARSLSSFAVFERCKRFAANVLAEGQEAVSNVFAGFRGDRFARVDWYADADGRPLIDGAAAHFCCNTARVVPAGDHVILMGGIDRFACTGARGLGYAGGHYFSLGLEREAASAPRPGRTTVAGAIVEYADRVLLESTPRGLRPPQCVIDGPVRVRETLRDHFTRIGLDVSLGKAYSIFDDGVSGIHYIYFLTRAGTAKSPERYSYLPIDSLPADAFVTSAHATMIDRFAVEHRTRCFGLYVGNEAGGDIHPFN